MQVTTRNICSKSAGTTGTPLSTVPTCAHLGRPSRPTFYKTSHKGETAKAPNESAPPGCSEATSINKSGFITILVMWLELLHPGTH